MTLILDKCFEGKRQGHFMLGVLVTVVLWRDTAGSFGEVLWGIRC